MVVFVGMNYNVTLCGSGFITTVSTYFTEKMPSFMSQVLIISHNPSFSGPLAAIAARECGWEMAVAEHYELTANLSLVVAHTLPQQPLPCPVLLVPEGKPQKIHTLLANMQQLMHKPQRVALTDELTLLPREKRIITGDKGIDLTDKEQALILYLMEHGTASRETLLGAIWGVASDTDTHTLETHLYRLRQKWREISDEECIVASEHGYQWNCA